MFVPCLTNETCIHLQVSLVEEKMTFSWHVLHLLVAVINKKQKQPKQRHIAFLLFLIFQLIYSTGHVHPCTVPLCGESTYIAPPWRSGPLLGNETGLPGLRARSHTRTHRRAHAHAPSGLFIWQKPTWYWEKLIINVEFGCVLWW